MKLIDVFAMFLSQDHTMEGQRKWAEEFFI